MKVIILFILLIGMKVQATPIGDAFRLIRSHPMGKVTPAPPVTDCRAQISKIICLVDPPQSGQDPLTRPCLPGAESYARTFESHFDRSQPLIQKMYCHLEKIWIEKQFYATAYATSIQDDPQGPVTGGAIGIRREVLDSGVALSPWLTWKEETNFGGSHNSQDPSLGVLQYRAAPSSHEAFLDLVLNHEFGHLFDFANDLNRVEDCRWEKDANGEWQQKGTCVFAPQTFAQISWEHWGHPPRLGDRFPYFEKICFYSCTDQNHIDPQVSATLFSGLMQTQFATTYSSVNAMEDWAETFTLYLMLVQNGSDLRLETQGSKFDFASHYRSPLLKAKREYVKDFILKGPRYPGEI